MSQFLGNDAPSILGHLFCRNGNANVYKTLLGRDEQRLVYLGYIPCRDYYCKIDRPAQREVDTYNLYGHTSLNNLRNLRTQKTLLAAKIHTFLRYA